MVEGASARRRQIFAVPARLQNAWQIDVHGKGSEKKIEYRSSND